MYQDQYCRLHIFYSNNLKIWITTMRNQYYRICFLLFLLILAVFTNKGDGQDLGAVGVAINGKKFEEFCFFLPFMRITSVAYLIMD